MGVLKEIQESQKRSIKKIIYMVFGIFFVGLCVYYFLFFSKVPESTYEVKTAEYGDIKTTFLSDGKVVAKNQITQSFQTTGEVKSIDKSIGQIVHIGDKIANLDDTYLNLELQKARINLEISQANLLAKEKSLSKENIDLAQKDLDYQKSLFENTKTQLLSQTEINQKTYEVAGDTYNNLGSRVVIC